MPESKATLVQSRLLRRVRELGLQSVDHYADYFFTQTQTLEREHFINAITTNKTDFFREPEHFEFLDRTALPSLGRRAGDPPAWRLNAWSAGCSSGEEPYSLAMALSEYAVRRRGFDFGILGTDVSTRVLSRASQWHLSARANRSGSDRSSQESTCCRAETVRNSWSASSPALRRKVTFHQLNFMDDEYHIRDMFDLIFFRNVMIYFEQSTQEAVISKLCRNLSAGGYLFVGHSESLAGFDIPVRPVKTSIYRKLL